MDHLLPGFYTRAYLGVHRSGGIPKFTPSGGRVTVDAVRSVDSPDQLVLRVTDTGVGIPQDKLEAIFQPFVQVDAGRARATEGTGLGLAISRDLARGMSGDLAVESALGEGSTFTLILPLVGTAA